MRILLTANASYVPPRGGATRSNLVWLEHLAAAGHQCRIVAAELAGDPGGRGEQMRNEEIRLSGELTRDGVRVVERGGITVHSAADPARRGQLLREQIRDFQPDWVLVSSEDLGQMLLREAQQNAAGRVVYLAHTPQLFPFGPASWNPDSNGARLVQECAGIVAIGRHTAGYIRRYTGKDPEVIHPPIYGSGPHRRLGAFDSGLIGMINPCAVKGISIFLALAKSCPEYQFGALPGWGTTRSDRHSLKSLPNVTVLPNVRHIEQFLEHTRVLLMPSLWYEGFGLSVMEAMLHGVPVISSDSGGLVEAKMGTRFVIPVRPIERYEPVFDEHGLPEAVAPEQDIEPWVEALRALLSDPALYDDEAAGAQERAVRFVRGLRPERMQEYLQSLAPGSAAAARPPAPAAVDAGSGSLGALSPDKRALLLQRLRRETPPRGTDANRRPPS